MTPLITWDWPDTPITIGVIALGAVVAQWIAGLLLGRLTRLIINTADKRIALLPGRAARTLASASEPAKDRHAQRTRTMGRLLRSVTMVFVTVIAILSIMQVLGLPLSPLLASAGVGGVALGFGAQSLVKDYLSGIFMILEDQYGVGDQIDVGDVTGTVEDVTLRVTRIRDAAGMVWYIRNGEIVRVGNVSKGFSTAVIDVPVAYDSDVVKATRTLEAVAKELDGDEKWSTRLLEPPQVLGVESISAGSIVLRMSIKCPPNEQWGVARELRERAQIALIAAGIKGPVTPLPVVPHA